MGIKREKNISFDDWATEYEQILDARIRSGELHSRTKGSYASMLARGREVFGSPILDPALPHRDQLAQEAAREPDA